MILHNNKNKKSWRYWEIMVGWIPWQIWFWDHRAKWWVHRTRTL